MNHSFNVDIAVKYGVNTAIILENMYHWIFKNRANGKNFHDGFYWTYNTVSAYKEIYPYLSEKAIRAALKKAEDADLLITGNYNKQAYDRTKWYALTAKGWELFESGKCICRKGQMETPERANDNCPKGQTNTSYKPVVTSDINHIEGTRKRFTPPSVSEVRDYAEEKGIYLDAEHFCDFYESNGWKVGRNPMRDWKAAVRNWAKRDSRGRAKDPHAPDPEGEAWL